MTANLSVRVEFFEDTDHDGLGIGERAGSVLQEDGFDGVAVPRVGELVSVIGLFGRDLGQLIRPAEAGGFIKVVRVEHFPISVPGEGKTLGDTEWTTPSANLVFHAKAPTDDRSITKLNEGLRARGWSVLRD